MPTTVTAIRRSNRTSPFMHPACQGAGDGLEWRESPYPLPMARMEPSEEPAEAPSEKTTPLGAGSA